MTGIQSFSFEGAQVRTVLVDGDPWWVAADVCAVLGLQSGRALARLDEDEKGVRSTQTPGGPQMLAYVNEPGLYSLVLGSRKPEAKAFKRWVTREVLPAIRRTGRYEAQPPAQLTNRDLALMVIAEADRAEAAEQRIAELEPMAAQAAHYRSAEGLIAIGDFANDLKGWAARQLGLRVLHPQVWEFLGEIGLLIRGNTLRRNEPTAYAVEHDYIRAKKTEFETKSRGLQTSSTPRLTPKGAGWAWDRAVRRLMEHNGLSRDDGDGDGGRLPHAG